MKRESAVRIALDPGKTTGVAWRGWEAIEATAYGDTQPRFVRGIGELRGIEWPGQDIVVVLDGFEVGYGIEEVIVENFRSRPGPAVNLSPPEVIGRILAWADERGIPVVRQDASPVKVRVTNDRLRAAGGWLRGQDHARDALRHLLYREETLGLIRLVD